MLAGCGVALRSLDDYPDLPAVSEDGATFLENALKKARAVASLTGEVALADDSGLAVQALGGAPGIRSARYAGEDADDRRNIVKLLDALRDVPSSQRGATFHCVLALCRPDGSCEAFDGRWEGVISQMPSGHNGFGYDPVFYLPEQGRTVAELPTEAKNQVSHRARAVEKLKARLREEDRENGA
jgi:XTP/dITP diphosphohydrolase